MSLFYLLLRSPSLPSSWAILSSLSPRTPSSGQAPVLPLLEALDSEGKGILEALERPPGNLLCHSQGQPSWRGENERTWGSLGPEPPRNSPVVTRFLCQGHCALSLPTVPSLALFAHQKALSGLTLVMTVCAEGNCSGVGWATCRYVCGCCCCSALTYLEGSGQTPLALSTR